MSFIKSSFLILLLVFLPGVSFANVDCAATFSRYPNFTRIGINYAALSREAKNVLKGKPAFLLSPYNPKYEEIRSTNLGSFTEVTVNEAYSKRDSYELVLELFKAEQNADYVFIGNGFYPIYLMARSIFDGTPMAERVKFIPFSRPLAAIAVNNPSSVELIFRRLQIGEPSNRKIIVIDSTTSQNGNNHSVTRTANAVRKHLISRGWDFERARDAVIAMGMVETSTAAFYFKNSIEKYYEALRSIPSFESGETFPIYESPVKWMQDPFKTSYGNTGGSVLYWNGKYNSTDRSGLPLGTVGPEAIQKYEAEDLRQLVETRGGLAKAYNEIIEHGLRVRQELQEKIFEVLRENRIEVPAELARPIIEPEQRTESVDGIEAVDTVETPLAPDTAPVVTAEPAQRNSTANNQQLVPARILNFDGARQTRRIFQGNGGQVRVAITTRLGEGFKPREVEKTKAGLDRLRTVGFHTASFESARDQEIIFSVGPNDIRLVSEILSSNRDFEIQHRIANLLTQTILQSASNRLYISGLRPRDLFLDSTNSSALSILSVDEVRPMSSEREVLERYLEKIDAHWSQALPPGHIEMIKNDLRQRIESLSQDAA